LGLLLLREERNAGRDGALDLPGGYPDAMLPAAEALVQLQADAGPQILAALGASDAARPDVTADALQVLRRQAAAAEK
jgi:hypothetical protein